MHKVWCKSRSGTRMDELSSLEQILLAGRKLNTWVGGTWELGYLQSSLWMLSCVLSSLLEWAGSSELRHKLWAQPRVCLSPSTFCCCHLQRRVSWITPELGGNKKILIFTWKNLLSVPGLQQELGLKIRVGHSQLQGCICFQSLWQGCSFRKSINLNQIKLMCCHIYPVSLVVLHHVLAYKLHDRVIQGLPADTETNPHVKLPADVLFQLL